MSSLNETIMCKYTLQCLHMTRNFFLPQKYVWCGTEKFKYPQHFLNNAIIFRLNENVRLLRVPETQLRSLDYEPYEFVDESRQISENSEWSELIQFALRKAERFMKSNVFEIAIPDEITESGRYSPRFIDEISDELNVFSDDSGIQDKKAPFLGEMIKLICY